MKIKLKSIIFAIALPALLIQSCKKDDHDHEEELITTLKVTLTPVGGGSAKFFIYKDLDGDGANVASIVTDSLDSNKIYNLVLEFINEAENPAKDITAEIRNEGKDHQVFYQLSNSNLGTIKYTDADGDGRPLGLSAEFTASKSVKGSLKITLRHEPNKAGNNVANGDITNAKGETDIEVDFPIFIK